MNEVTILFRLPVPSAALLEEPEFNQKECILRFLYRIDGRRYEGGIEFHRVAAMRKFAERACNASLITPGYDQLIFVVDSDWASEIWDRIPKHHRPWQARLNHYMIYLDSFGCLEVLAAGWESFQAEVER